MAHCPIDGCDWHGKKSGVPIHLARKHAIHPAHDAEPTPPPINIQLEHESNTLEDTSNPPIQICPVIGCGLLTDNLLDHAHASHPDWLLSNGRFVFEVGP